MVLQIIHLDICIFWYFVESRRGEENLWKWDLLYISLHFSSHFVSEWNTECNKEDYSVITGQFWVLSRTYKINLIKTTNDVV